MAHNVRVNGSRSPHRDQGGAQSTLLALSLYELDDSLAAGSQPGVVPTPVANPALTPAVADFSQIAAALQTISQTLTTVVAALPQVQAATAASTAANTHNAVEAALQMASDSSLQIVSRFEGVLGKSTAAAVSPKPNVIYRKDLPEGYVLVWDKYWTEFCDMSKSHVAANDLITKLEKEASQIFSMKVPSGKRPFKCSTGPKGFDMALGGENLVFKLELDSSLTVREMKERIFFHKLHLDNALDKAFAKARLATLGDHLHFDKVKDFVKTSTADFNKKSENIAGPPGLVALEESVVEKFATRLYAGLAKKKSLDIDKKALQLAKPEKEDDRLFSDLAALQPRELDAAIAWQTGQGGSGLRFNRRIDYISYKQGKAKSDVIKSLEKLREEQEAIPKRQWTKRQLAERRRHRDGRPSNSSGSTSSTAFGSVPGLSPAKGGGKRKDVKGKVGGKAEGKGKTGKKASKDQKGTGKGKEPKGKGRGTPRGKGKGGRGSGRGKGRGKR